MNIVNISSNYNFKGPFTSVIFIPVQPSTLINIPYV